MRINHNIAALNTYRQLNSATGAQSKSMEKLSSGLRINKAGDDAAGLAISEKMRGQIRGLDMASKNAQDGVSMLQTAEGALNETHDILQRMRELATQAANDTNTDTDRGEIQKEINQLTSEINRIGNTTEFNTQKLLNGGEGQTGSGDSAKFHQITGTAAMDTDFSVETSTITIGDTSVTLDQTYADEDEVLEALNTGFEGTGITFSKTASNELVVSGAEGFKVEVTETDATTASISIANDTDSTEQNVEYSVTGTAAMDTDFSVETSTITIGDTSVTLDQTYADEDEVLEALNTGFEGTGITFEMTASNELVVKGAEGFTVEVTETDATTASISIANDTAATSNVPTGLELSSGATGEGFSASFQIGANAGQSMTIDIRDMRSTGALKIASENGTTVESKSGKTASYTEATDVTNGTDNEGTFKALDVSSHDKASAAIDVINDAIEEVSAERSKLGAFSNRLEHTINNLGTSSENLTAAESRVRDVDMAKEMMAQTKNSILSQAAQAMLAQANQQPQGVLQLLR